MRAELVYLMQAGLANEGWADMMQAGLANEGWADIFDAG
jgi:hypothetical protein